MYSFVEYLCQNSSQEDFFKSQIKSSKATFACDKKHIIPTLLLMYKFCMEWVGFLNKPVVFTLQYKTFSFVHFFS